MTDERIDALIRRLDVQADPDAGFVSTSAAVLVRRVRAARVQDASRLGRLRRDLRLGLAFSGGTRVRGPVAVVVVLLLMLAGLVAAIAIGRALTKPSNGLLIASMAGELRAIDVESGRIRPLGPSGEEAVHVSRAPDGSTAAFWRLDPDGDQLTFMDVATGVRRFGVADVAIKWGGCIDTWSSDSRWLASEVTVRGVNRLLVVDSTTGAGHLVTPEGITAHCPLWSPDGAWIAFTLESKSGTRTLAIIRTDGSGMREISGRLGGLAVSGPDTWSPDGAWIYFDASRSGVGRVFRANVTEGQSTPLTEVGMLAAAPASSPDGTQIAFIISEPGGWDLYAANSDGSNAHRLLEHANNLGWSADGRYILTDWTPPDKTGGLAILSPDGAEFRIIDPVYKVCSEALGSCDLGWGQARP